MTLAQIAALTEGRVDASDPHAVVRGITIDSRTAHEDDLFAALVGSTTDGHAFAADARAHGATAVLAREGADVSGVASIRVSDVAAALLRVGAAVRAASSARVVAITGSSGKTCTKQLAAAAAASTFRTVSSRESYNNELGVPLTLCSIDEDTEVLVAEIGSRGLGHIAALMPAVRPDIAIVTNVGPAHYEMFGSLDTTARAKGEIVESLPPEGTAVLNADDPRVAAMASRTRAHVVTFGMGDSANVRASEIQLDRAGRASFVVRSPSGTGTIALRLHGEHMVPNALAALAAAEALGVAFADAADAIANVPSVSWRMEIVDAPNDVTLVNDAYNSNPASAAAALRSLAGMRARGRRAWAVLGEMAELGPIAHDEHDRLGRLAVRLGIDRLVAVGEAARPVVEAARLECMTPDEAAWVPDASAAAALLRDELRPGDVVLVKGSRVAGLERVVAALAGLSA
jgi:UDP-N-acetylmuramoyl-tripeptide--D-alanyl-D-alanine ligase